MNEVYPIVASKGFSVARNGVAAADPASNDGAQGWMRGHKPVQPQPVVNAHELTSLSALISYVAYQSGSTEFGIERKLSDRFNIPNTKCLPANQYDSAIRYLVDSFSAA